ncbi:MAG: XdhC family protein [Pseudomonadota bacterium]
MMHDMVATLNKTAGSHADPVSALSRTDGALAVISGVEGSAYRPIGSVMAFLDDRIHVGSLSSGCMEESLAIQAEKARAESIVHHVRYGQGSPWMDIKLPCGAGLDITLWPSNHDTCLKESFHLYTHRIPHSLRLPKHGLQHGLTESLAPAGWSGKDFILPRIPPLQLVVFGTGIETMTFANLAQAAGYATRVMSPDSQVCRALPDAVSLETGMFPSTLEPDAQTAVVFFFHESDHEIRLLPSALDSAAFWIGTQGSRRKREVMREDLKAAGVSIQSLDRLQPRFGTIPSARDPQTLAVSVLADVVSAYKARWFDPYFGQTGTSGS